MADLAHETLYLLAFFGKEDEPPLSPITVQLVRDEEAAQCWLQEGIHDSISQCDCACDC